MKRQTARRPKQYADRRGAVAVEFAFMAPVLVTIAMGTIEVSRMYESQNLLHSAAREGARFASVDKTDMLAPGETTNDKIVADVKTFLGAQGVPPDKVDVSITEHDDPNTDFDLDDPANELELFDVTVAIDYSEMSFTPVPESSDFPLDATVTFRNGRATLSD
ncbi:MAG: TadE family protein [Planctomycetota bacterium]